MTYFYPAREEIFLLVEAIRRKGEGKQLINKVAMRERLEFLDRYISLFVQWADSGDDSTRRVGMIASSAWALSEQNQTTVAQLARMLPGISTT